MTPSLALPTCLVLTVLAASPVRAQLVWEQAPDVYGVVVHGLADVEGTPYVGTRNGLYRLGANERWERIAFEHRSVQQVGMAAGRLFALVEGRIHVSDDEGKSWEVSLEQSIYNVANGPGVVMAYAADSIWVSSDAGGSWQSAPVPPEPYWTGIVTTVGSWLTASYDGSTWRSVDRGRTWTRVHKVSTGLASSFYEASGVLYKTHHDSNQSGENEDGIYRSGDDGQSWERLGIEVGTSSVVEAEGVLIASTFEGVRHSYDGGVTWTAAQEPWVPHLVFAGGDLYGARGGSSEGVHVSGDGGVTWRTLGQGLLADDVPLLAAGGGSRVYAIAEWGPSAGLFASDDAGLTWRDITPAQFSDGADPLQVLERRSGEVLVVQRGRITSLSHGYEEDLPDVPSSLQERYVAEASDGTLYALAADIYRLAGETWEPQGIPTGYASGFTIGSDGTMLAFSYDGTMWKRSAGTEHWQAITLIPWALQKVFMVGDAILGFDGNWLWRSVDEGQNWEKAYDGLLDLVEPDGQGGLLAVASVPASAGSRTLLRSGDAGVSWAQMGMLPYGYWTRAVAVTGTGHLLASVAYNGLYRSQQPLPTATEALRDPSTGTLRVYPSPAWNEVLIEGRGRFEVFDVLGRRITAGEGERVRLDVEQYPAGLYFVRRDGEVQMFNVLR